MNSTDSQSQVLLLTDWEYETWHRIYFKVQRNATFTYAFTAKEAKENKYPEKLDKIEKTLLKTPQLLTPKKIPESSPSVETRENRHKLPGMSRNRSERPKSLQRLEEKEQ